MDACERQFGKTGQWCRFYKLAGIAAMPHEYIQFNTGETAIVHTNGMNATGHYHLTGSVLSLISDSLSLTFKIKTLTYSSLVLSAAGEIRNGETYTDEYFTK